MGIVAVVHEVVQILVQCLGTHLALILGQRNDLVLRKLNGSSLVDVDMATADADDALILIEHGINGGSIGLRASRQEENLGIGHTDSLADTAFGALAEFVEAIGRRLGIVILDQVL